MNRHSKQSRFYASILLTAAAFASQAADNIPSSGLQYINTNYQFIYHGCINMNKRLSEKYWENESCTYEVDYQYEFLGERTYDDKKYSVFVLTCQTVHEHPKDYSYDYETKHMPFFYNVFIREDNGKVYARVKPLVNTISALSLYGSFFDDKDNPKGGKERARLYFYGSEDEEVLIYDNNLTTGEAYCVHNNAPQDYEIPDDIAAKRKALDNIAKEEAFLNLWNGGRLTLEKISYDDAGREVRTFRQNRTEWWDGHMMHDDTAEEAPESRTFEFIEGIGCTKGFLFNPGMYPPYVKPLSEADAQDILKPFASPSITLLRVIDKRDGSIVYENKTAGVEDIEADVAVLASEPEYYNIQGMRVANPQEGEIYIVKRGTRATKEVYRR